MMCQAMGNAAPDTRIPDNIPLGDAADNTETSRAIRLIINKAATAYKRPDEAYLEASVTTVYKTKKKQRIDKGKVSFWYQSPDKVHAELSAKSNNKMVINLFNADGTTITMMHGNEYLQYPQTVPLAAFTANRRDGEIWNDYSGAFANGDGASLLLSEDPVEWIDASVLQYIYEGEEDVNGHRCWRIKFVQENDGTVTIFVEKKTGIILRDSTVVAYDSDGNRTESFEQAASGSISVYTTDKITTSGVKFPRDVFKLKLPPNSKRTNTTEASQVTTETKEGLWNRLLRAAEKSKASGTSITVSRQAGQLQVHATTLHSFEQRVGNICRAPKGDGTSSSLLALLEDGTVFDLKGTAALKLFSLPNNTLYIKPLNAETTSTLLCVNQVTDKITARDSRGNQLWTYYNPQNTFYDVRSFFMNGKDIVRIIMDEEGGLRLLSDRGEVLHASTEKYNINMAMPDPADPNRIVYGSASSTGLMDGRLKRTKDIPLDGWLVSGVWNHADETHPVVAISMNSDYDATLESIGFDGRVGWRQVMQLKVPETFLPYTRRCHIKVNGHEEDAIAAFLSTGFLTVVSLDGAILFRGNLNPESIIAQRTEIKFIGFVAADLDQDGFTEFYTTSDTNVVKITLQ
jgi:hypothetical protein